MACDLQFTTGSDKWKGRTKIYKVKAHPSIYPRDFLIGFAGTAGGIIAVMEYFNNPETTKPPKVRELRGLVLTEDKLIFTFDEYDKWLGVNQDYKAIGSGMAIATGAMASGSTPKEAVKIASQFDIFSGMGVKVLRI
jgi:ATP-dependent protease HslVU (ClpYQ) peptidase subunit